MQNNQATVSKSSAAQNHHCLVICEWDTQVSSAKLIFACLKSHWSRLSFRFCVAFPPMYESKWNNQLTGSSVVILHNTSRDESIFFERDKRVEHVENNKNFSVTTAAIIQKTRTGQKALLQLPLLLIKLVAARVRTSLVPTTQLLLRMKWNCFEIR